MKNKYKMLVSFIVNVEALDEVAAHEEVVDLIYAHEHDRLESLHIETLRKVDVPVQVPAPELTVVPVPGFVPGLKASPEIVPVTAADDIPF